VDVFRRGDIERGVFHALYKTDQAILFNATGSPDICHFSMLAVLAVLAVYGHIPQLHSVGGFTLLLIAYVVLLLGTLLRGI
jgi:hypothetical protein